MRAIILCGGRGMRLNEMTEFMPKPLIEIGGRPILYHIFDLYVAHGITEFDLACGYKKDMIVDYISKYRYSADVSICCHDTGEETQTADRVKMIDPKETFALTYGDGISCENISALIGSHHASTNKPHMTISGGLVRSRWGKLVIKKSKVVEINEKPIEKDYVNCGFWIVDPEMLKYIQPNDTTETWADRIARDGKCYIHWHDKFWMGIDTMRDYNEANKLWGQHHSWDIEL